MRFQEYQVAVLSRRLDAINQEDGVGDEKDLNRASTTSKPAKSSHRRKPGHDADEEPEELPLIDGTSPSDVFSTFFTYVAEKDDKRTATHCFRKIYKTISR